MRKALKSPALAAQNAVRPRECRIWAELVTGPCHILIAKSCLSQADTGLYNNIKSYKKDANQSGPIVQKRQGYHAEDSVTSRTEGYTTYRATR